MKEEDGIGGNGLVILRYAISFLTGVVCNSLPSLTGSINLIISGIMSNPPTTYLNNDQKQIIRRTRDK